MQSKKTLRIKYPEWHGGVNPNYVLGSNLLSIIAPPNPKDEEVEIKIDNNFSKTDKFEGIDCGEELLKELNQTYSVLKEKSPTHIIIFGGDCSVSQAPFDYLKGKYGENLGIIWFDAHPDVSLLHQSSHLHELVLGNLMGQNPNSKVTKVNNPISPKNVLMAGLIEEKLRPMDSACKELNLQIISPEELSKSSDKILKWIENNNIKYLAIHWDLDVLSPNDFRCIYPAEPYININDFPWAIGRMKLIEVGKVLEEISKKAEIVGFTLAEHMAWDALNLRKTLSNISIFNN